MIKKFIAVILILNYLFIGNSFGTNVAACGSLGTPNGNYNLTQNITSTTSCIVIAASGITFDGHGYTITYGTAGSSLTTARYGIDNTGGYDNLVIKNTNVRMINAARSAAKSFYAIGMINSLL